ncbi:MAG: YeiH family protein [Chloroflexi bacterium]|nr:YeiH family protein [Chloroflexota bacterium]
MQQYVSLFPGLVLVLAIATVANFSAGFLPPAINGVIVAILLGLLIKNTINVPYQFQPGIKFSLQKLLRLAIILLGIRLSFFDVLRIGAQSLAIIIACMSAALLLAYLGGRLFKLPNRLALLIGVGTAICGNSAIVATAPVLEAKDEEVSFAVATITLFGTLAVFLYPAIGLAAHMSDSFFGTWAGTAVNDTSQVVATGFAFSNAAGQVATVVKLTRNALMAPVIVLIGILWARASARSVSTSGLAAKQLKLTKIFPYFVLGFVGMALLNTIEVFPKPVVAQVNNLSSFLILMALSGVGLGTNLSQMRKTGLRPFYLGLFTAAVVASLSVLLITVVGIR